MAKLEKGEILILDKIAYRIGQVERLIYVEPISLDAGQTDKLTDVKNLTPEDKEIYHIEELDWSGPTRHQFQYPRGVPRHTPHGVDVKIREWQCPYTVEVHVKKATFPTLVSDNELANASITQDVWFYGWMYKDVEIIKAEEVESARRAGIRVLEAEA
jgi:hypothetical protein